MRKKPKGVKYRNLTARGGVIQYSRRVGGRRIRRSLETDDWEKAAAAVRLFEQEQGIGRFPFVESEPLPTFAEFAARYLKEGTGHLAQTTLADRKRYLGPAGEILKGLGAKRLDEIGKRDISEWWVAQGFGQRGEDKGKREGKKNRTVATGRTYLDAISGVLGHAELLELIEENPADRFRRHLRKEARTQSGRAASDPQKNARPIERPEEIERLLEAAREEGFEDYTFTLTGLDAGLRRGEVLGLKWGAIHRGVGEEADGRRLEIESNRPRGGDEAPAKSGRGRRVALSLRLRDALLTLCRLRENPPGDARVFPRNIHRREWQRILDRAGIGHRQFKDLRDTFASQLLTAGVNLAYISDQLGHADEGVTRRHYARWCAEGEYREPMRLRPGEVPADLLARLDRPQSGHTSETAESFDSENPRPFAVLLEHETGFEPATSTLATWCSTS